MPVRAKRFEYTIAVDRAGRVSAPGSSAVELEPIWTADHLLLAALASCVIESLRHHAERAGLDAVASAEASGVVTKREADGRYAFVEIECALDVELDAVPPPDELDALIAKAERDCFVGNSLTVGPAYGWRVNGAAVTARGGEAARAAGNVEP